MTTSNSRTALVLLAALLAVIAAPAARGQGPGPAGNAHPESHAVSESQAPETEELEPSASTPQMKVDFAKAVDLSPLRDLAVFHNGRVKILDSLARETVKGITGRRNYIEYVPEPAGSELGETVYRKEGMDPLFTLLDVMIDTGYYSDRPVLGVDYLPLRRLIAELEHPGDAAGQEKFLRFLRISPAVVRKHAQALDREAAQNPQLARALREVSGSVELLERSGRNLLVIAPSFTDEKWLNILDLRPPPRGEEDTRTDMERAAFSAFADFLRAWSKLDAPAVNRAAKELAARLPAIHTQTYPTTRRTLELVYNKTNAFEWGFFAYFVALVTLLLAFGTGRRWLAVSGSVMLVAAVGLHAFGFITRCLIAERFAIQNQFESMTGLSLFAAVAGLTIMLARRQWLFGAATAAMGFMVLIAATQLDLPGKEIGREAAILNTSVLLKYHVTTVLVSYGLISLGFIVSLFYLGAHYFGAPASSETRPSGSVPATAGGPDAIAVALSDEPTTTRAKLLADLDKAQMTVLQLAFWGLGVGILLGAWWADHSWGRWWAFDPKETWALLTWIVYLITIHVRIATGNKGVITAWLSVAGFIVMLWTYFGVNLLLPGLHAYA